MRITMTDWIHNVLKGHIREGDCCIDATMGKGSDRKHEWTHQAIYTKED